MNMTFNGDIDHSVLQQELIKAIGPMSIGWGLLGAQGSVTFVVENASVPNPTAVIEAHIAGALDRFKKSLMTKVDDHIAGIYGKFQRFQTEYLTREASALAYKNAGYTGTSDQSIQTFATGVGLTYNQGVDKVLEQAAALRGAVTMLGTLRMAKYGIQSAADKAAAQQAYDNIIGQANQIAALL